MSAMYTERDYEKAAVTAEILYRTSCKCVCPRCDYATDRYVCPKCSTKTRERGVK